jgi:transketolase
VPDRSPMTSGVASLEVCARNVRAHILRMAHAAQAPHVGSALSCVDLLVALYWSVLRIDPRAPDDPDRDRLILSKGHGCTAQYAALAERGFFPKSVLEEYARDGGRLAEHAGPRCVPGIEAATGSLGHGLAMGAGLAIAAKLQGACHRVFVILSDGECFEGSVWEGALLAAAQRLDNLVGLVDFNGWSAMDRTWGTLEPLTEKWRCFGWAVREIDGHDFGQILPALQSAPLESKRPTMIIARTVKGKGVSFMEDDLEWHYRPPSSDDLARALREIGP